MKAMKNFPSIIRTEYAIARIIHKDAEKNNRILNNLEQAKKKILIKQTLSQK